MLETLEMVELLILQLVSLVDSSWSSRLVGFYLQKYISVTCFCKSIMPLWPLVGYLSLLPFLLFQSRLLFFLVKSLRYQPPISLGQFVILNTMFRVFQVPCLKPVFCFAKSTLCPLNQHFAAAISILLEPLTFWCFSPYLVEHAFKLLHPPN